MSKDATEVFTGISPYGFAFSETARELTLYVAAPYSWDKVKNFEAKRLAIGSTAMGILRYQAPEICQALTKAFGGVAKAGDWLTGHLSGQPRMGYPLVMLAKNQPAAVLTAAAAASKNRCVVA